MPGPMPKKNPARRNKTTTRATLPRDHDVTAPALPEREQGWHKQTVAWWADIWASPMAPEFEKADLHGLFVLADLWDAFWTADTPKERTALAAEIRLQRRDFGLTPLDRRRLQWEIERAEDAQDRGTRRRQAPRTPVADPRAVLHAVK